MPTAAASSPRNKIELARYAPLILAVAFSLGFTGCYTQLGATSQGEQATTAGHTAESVQPGTARVGLGGMAQEEYVAEYGYADEEYVHTDDVYYDDDVAVTHYYADDGYYDAYHRRHSTTYVSYNYYFPRYRTYYAPRPRFHGAWTYLYDPFYGPRPGMAFHVGISFGSFSVWHDPYWSAASWYHPAAYWHRPYFYDPYAWSYGYGYPAYSPYGWSSWHSPHWGFARNHYRSGYSTGYAHGWYDGYYSSTPFAGGVWGATRSRGAARTALSPHLTRDRRSALAAATSDSRRLALDAPVGTREARRLADDARQVVLVNRAGTATQTGDRQRAGRQSDDPIARQPSVGTTPRAARPAGTPDRATATTRSGEPGARGTAPVTRQPAQPERSRWGSPDRGTGDATPQRGTRDAQPQRGTGDATPQRGTRDAQPQRGTEAQPPRGQAQPPRGQAQPPRGQAQPPRGQAQPPRGQAQPPRQETQPPPQRDRVAPPPPPRTTREAPPREEQQPRSRPAPPPSNQDARQARPRTSGNARPAPPRTRSSARPAQPRPQPSARPSSSSSSDSGARSQSGRSGSSQGTRSTRSRN